MSKPISDNALAAFADLLVRDTRVFKAAERLVEEGGLLRKAITEIEEARLRSGWSNQNEADRARQYRKRLKELSGKFADTVKAVRNEAYATIL